MQFKLIFNHALLTAKKCSIATTFEVRLVKKGQARKSARGMPWHQEPTKDAAICEKPRGAESRL